MYPWLCLSLAVFVVASVYGCVCMIFRDDKYFHKLLLAVNSVTTQCGVCLKVKFDLHSNNKRSCW